ncbi:unnamed protein product [Sphagnum troendelagicum]|uniref:Uncharacterized protein n=1 Tax=Sphagnum troendelagicum TaxID=128251 RepID=A0ABP0UEX7_9BRYO
MDQSGVMLFDIHTRAKSLGAYFTPVSPGRQRIHGKRRRHSLESVVVPIHVRRQRTDVREGAKSAIVPFEDQGREERGASRERVPEVVAERV